MSDEKKELGCCGYDELAEKPATTKPMVFGMRAQRPVKPEFDPYDRSLTRRLQMPSSMGSRIQPSNLR